MTLGRLRESATLKLPAGPLAETPPERRADTDAFFG
jgi:hypothetical protein